MLRAPHADPARPPTRDSQPVCACVLLRGFDAKGEVAVRPYTPTSSNDVKGSFDLLVKVYENGTVSKWLDGLEMGAPVGFKHIPFNMCVRVACGAIADSFHPAPFAPAAASPVHARAAQETAADTPLPPSTRTHL